MSNSKEYFQTIYKPKQTSSTLKKPAAIMDLNNFTSTAKWVSIMTTKPRQPLKTRQQVPQRSGSLMRLDLTQPYNSRRQKLT